MDYPNRENFYHVSDTVKKDIPCTFVRDFMTEKANSLTEQNTTAKDTWEAETTTAKDTISNTATVKLPQNMVTTMSDKPVEKVNHPSHYNSVKKETIKILEDYLTDEEYDGFLKGNVIKYMHRYKFKNGIEDLQKAKWYLEELIRKNTK